MFPNSFENIVFIDFETTLSKEIYEIGAFFGDKVLKLEKIKDIRTALKKLDNFSFGADYIAGHNIIDHDLKIAEKYYPEAYFLKLPVIDTLFLSPLAFPQNPYHKLIKNYKLVKNCKNDPVEDSKLSSLILKDQVEAFLHINENTPDLISFYSFAFNSSEIKGRVNNFKGAYDLFNSISSKNLAEEEAFELFKQLTKNKICEKTLSEIKNQYFYSIQNKTELAYVLSWLMVAGGNSVIPPWVKHEFKNISHFIKRLRYFCGDDNCKYCKKVNNSRLILEKYFGFEDYRTLPDGRKLQKSIVDTNLKGVPVLGILPTGGGKTICYQVPALHRFERLGELTIIISPLKALMKDQVDNLNRSTGTLSAAAINGSLTLPERAAVMEKVRLGDIAVLYISPEQLRNKKIAELLESRDIGMWVFDEAHCLSKWGHDFRPDYIYVSQFIKEHSRKTGNMPYVCAYTATAKKDVIHEIKDHFLNKLNLDFELFAGGVERDNLDYYVYPVTKASKDDVIFNFLNEKLSLSDGGGIVYCSSRKSTEILSSYLKSKGLNTSYFHAGRTEPEKRNLQDDFVNGNVDIICATNAFGMGIDKKDIRIVIHADIPGSLENYLQEAGRAGRDLEPSECILLYVEDDIEDQFLINSNSKLPLKSIKKILKLLRKKGVKTPNIIITPGEIKRLIGDESQDDTKVKTGISWLERKGFIERNYNKTLFFQGTPLVKSIDEARSKIERLNLSLKDKAVYEEILFILFNIPKNEIVSADEIVAALSKIFVTDTRFNDSKKIMILLSNMAKAGLIKEGIVFSAFVKPKGAGNSKSLLKFFDCVEKDLLKIMEELEPNASDNEKNIFNLRLITQRLKLLGHETIGPQGIEKILRKISNDRGKSSGKSFEIKGRIGADQRILYVKYDWDKIKKRSNHRLILAKVILDKIISLLPENLREGRAEVLSEFFLNDIYDAINNDITLLQQEIDFKEIINNTLLYLNDLNIIALQSGLGVFRQAMTLNLTGDSSRRQYTKGDYEPLEHYYQQKNFQVHVMDRYAKIGIDKIKNALKYVSEYFSMPYDNFMKKYFKDEKKLIQTAMTAEFYKKIVQDLNNNIQESITASHADKNLLVLAGPGSGKTKTIVHRCAWLVKAKSVLASSILVLCFNHHAMIELRKRIHRLAGKSGKHITIMTYHGFAMRITGRSFLDSENKRKFSKVKDSFNGIIKEASSVLNGEKEVAGIDADELREAYLSKFRYIFVDEYQDIDEDQYNFISAITGRLKKDVDDKITIMAVGDDDQSIYGFRDANIKFIRKFKEDYEAKTYYLVENYRSSHSIIETSNFLITKNKERMKTENLIRINDKRKDEALSHDQIDASDLVQLVESPGLEDMAVSAALEIKRLILENKELDYEDFAVVSRQGISMPSLVCARMALAANEIPFCYSLKKDAGFPLFKIREFQQMFTLLEKNKSKSMTPESLKECVLKLYPKVNIWVSQVEDILNSWCAVNPDIEISIEKARNFILEILLEEKREAKTGRGVFLGTVHSVKGMEFKYVFILDKGWQNLKSDFETEEERRLYYVGMTRAEKGLYLYSLTKENNPHIKILKESKFVNLRKSKEYSIKGYFENLKVSVIGMEDIFISWAGTKFENNIIHDNLKKACTGDRVKLIENNNKIYVVNSSGNEILVLSSNGYDKWKNRIQNIKTARILGMVKRNKSESDENFNVRVDSWEVPIVEVLHY